MADGVTAGGEVVVTEDGTGAVIMQADGVTVRAAVGDNGPEISLGGPDGVWVLRRLEEGPAPAGHRRGRPGRWWW